MLEQLFSSRARVKVLGLLLLNPQQRYYQRQIARLTTLPIRAVQRELERLESIGLVQREPDGNRVYFQVNSRHFLYPELKRIFLKTVGLRALLGETLRPHEGIQVAFVYGSYAADMETMESDIDLFVVGSISGRDLRAALRKVEEDTGREVNVYLTSPEALRGAMGNGFVRNVLAGPKVFLIGDEDALHALAAAGAHSAP